jgi:hypothetical protein
MTARRNPRGSTFSISLLPAILALIAVIVGALVSGIFVYRAGIDAALVPVHATQTAEAKVTPPTVTQSPTPTPYPTYTPPPTYTPYPTPDLSQTIQAAVAATQAAQPTATLTPTFTPTPTLTPPPTKAPTPLPTITPTPIPPPTPFQNFEPKNGTPLQGNVEDESDYFWDAWFMDCSFSQGVKYEGQRSMRCCAFADGKGGPNDTGGTAGIKPSSSQPVDLSSATTFYVWVYDTQGSNTVELKLCDDNGCPTKVWSAMKSIPNQWTPISWPMAAFTNVNRARIGRIEIYEWNDGVYYFDAIGWQ